MEEINNWIKDELCIVFSEDFTNKDIIKRYCFLKWIYSEKSLQDVISNIKKFIFYNLTSNNTRLLNNYIDNHDIDFTDNNLFDLCKKYLNEIMIAFSLIDTKKL